VDGIITLNKPTGITSAKALQAAGIALSPMVRFCE